MSKGDQLLAALATANKVREAPTPLYIKKQSEAILLCKEMKVLNALTSKERNAVLKTFTLTMLQAELLIGSCSWMKPTGSNI